MQIVLVTLVAIVTVVALAVTVHMMNWVVGFGFKRNSLFFSALAFVVIGAAVCSVLVGGIFILSRIPL